MALPLTYIARNLVARRLTTALTAGGMALVVYVFAVMLMLDEGLHQALVQTGAADNALVTRRSSETEIQSAVSRQDAAVIASQPEVALGPDGRRLASGEVVVLISLPRQGSGKPANVVIRGVSPDAFLIRRGVRVVHGRIFRAGSAEILAGAAVARQFAGTALGAHLRFAQREWTVVGELDAHGSAFDSEIWGDAQQLMQAFRRSAYSAVVVKLVAEPRLESLRARLESDPRLTVEARRESEYYEGQSRLLSRFILILGTTISLVFSAGAIIGAMVTMYSAVAKRTAEIGTLRALGFRRREILGAFVGESALLGFVGGAFGLLAASAMQSLSFSTMNFQSFAEISFGFVLSPRIALLSLAFGVLMGLLGGTLPALHAARLDIVASLRKV